MGDLATRSGRGNLSRRRPIVEAQLHAGVPGDFLGPGSGFGFQIAPVDTPVHRPASRVVATAREFPVEADSAPARTAAKRAHCAKADIFPRSETNALKHRDLGYSGRGGFSLIEIVVALAILVMIAATVTPAMIGYLDRERANEGSESLLNLAEAIASFHEDVGYYPSELSQLTEPVPNNGKNSCGSSFGGGAADDWNGPYLTRIIPSTGLPIFVGLAQNGLIRTPEHGGTHSSGTLTLVVTAVRLDDAEAMNQTIDSDASSSSGSVRWTAPDGDGFVTMYLLAPIVGC
jgi:prepilin-type N-terminal cleavage/methylation domain-containing protein